jgi:hypothetical protein
MVNNIQNLNEDLFESNLISNLHSALNFLKKSFSKEDFLLLLSVELRPEIYKHSNVNTIFNYKIILGHTSLFSNIYYIFHLQDNTFLFYFKDGYFIYTFDDFNHLKNLTRTLPINWLPGDDYLLINSNYIKIIFNNNKNNLNILFQNGLNLMVKKLLKINPF